MPVQPTTVSELPWRAPGIATSLFAGYERAPAYGGLSSIMKDNLYWFGARGFMFTSPWVITPRTVRQPAVMLLTTSGEAVEMTVGGHVVRQNAVAIAPLTTRGLCAIDVGLVSINVAPRHPRFGAFRQIEPPGLLGLDRRQFADFDGDLTRAYEGHLSFDEAHRLFEDAVEMASGLLPKGGRSDPREDYLHELLRENPTCSLDDLAREMNLSYTGASHLFSRVIGVPFRTYRQWLKCVKAAEQLEVRRKMTRVAHAAGFADSAHFSRTWQRNYGLSPTYIGGRRNVRVIA